MALVVRLKEGADASERKLMFVTSPVRIGRNPLNDLVLDHAFISQWHAVVRFDQNEIAYVDLGSTNGTTLNDVRLQERHPTPISGASSKLAIGPLGISLSWEDNTEQMDIGSPVLKTSFKTSFSRPIVSIGDQIEILPAKPSTSAEKTHTKKDDLDLADTLNRPLPVKAPSLSPQVSAGSAAKTNHMPPLDAPLIAVHQVSGDYEVFRKGWVQFLAQLREQIESSPPAVREVTAFFLANEFPEIRRQPEFADMLTEIGVDRVMVGCVDVDEWLRRLMHDQDKDAVSSKRVGPAIAMERVGAILEVFAESFLELRKGYAQFEKDMGLGINAEETPLERADSREAVIRFLMDPTVDGTQRLTELKRAFTNLAVHQVAVLHAVVEGARDLLVSLSPGAISAEENSTITSTAPRTLAVRGQAMLSIVKRVWPFGPALMWNRYQQQFESATEEDRFTRKLFGKKFARAYFAVSGSRQDT